MFLIMTILFSSCFMFFLPFALSEAPYRQWARTYGPIEGRSVVQTADGGYAIAGNAGVWVQARGPGNWVNYTFLLVKTNAAGDLQWKKTYGTGDKNYSRAFSLVQTSDGGYAIAGSKRSPEVVDGDRIVTFRLWLVKTDGEGNMQWNRTLPWSWESGPNVVLVKTSDGGYALAGSSGKPFLIKTNKDGNILWNVTFGGVHSDYIDALVATSDGGYAMAGDTSSFGAGGVDGWLVKTDSEGNLLWSKTYGTEGGEGFSSLVETDDGGYLLAGAKNVPNVGGYGWVVKTDSHGSEQWEMTYDVDFSRFFSAALSRDGGYVLAGDLGTSKALLVKVNAEGAVVWSVTHGESDDHYYSMVATSDGGYAVTGLKYGKNDVDNEVWLVKIEPEPEGQQASPTPVPPELFPITWVVAVILVVAVVSVSLIVYLRKRKTSVD